MIHLAAKRLVIRDPKLSDFNNWHQLMSDPKTMYYLQDIQTHAEDETLMNLQEAVRDISNPNREKYFLVIELGESGDFVGSIGYTVKTRTPAGKIVHLGYFILPKHHNKDYVTEALKELLRFAFDEDNVYRIETGCLAENYASERVMQKCGFIFEGAFKECEWHDGKMKDRVSYRLLKYEYKMSDK